MLESTVWACCALNCTLLGSCSATLFLSFEVRACYDSAVNVTGKKVVSVVVIFKIVARDFYVTKQRISTSRGCLSTSRLLLLPPRYGCRRLLALPRAKRIQTFASYLSLKLSVLPFHADLPWKSPCRLQSCPAQETESFWRPTACGIVDRSMDPEVLTAKGKVPHDVQRSLDWISLRTVFGRLPTQLQSQPASETHVALFRPS